MKILFIPYLNNFYYLFNSLNSILVVDNLLLLSSIIIGFLIYYHFSLKIRDTLIKVGSVVAGGAAAKAGSDGYDYTKDKVKKKLEEWRLKKGEGNAGGENSSSSNSNEDTSKK